MFGITLPKVELTTSFYDRDYGPGPHRHDAMRAVIDKVVPGPGSSHYATIELSPWHLKVKQRSPCMDDLFLMTREGATCHRLSLNRALRSSMASPIINAAIAWGSVVAGAAAIAVGVSAFTGPAMLGVLVGGAVAVVTAAAVAATVQGVICVLCRRHNLSLRLGINLSERREWFGPDPAVERDIVQFIKKYEHGTLAQRMLCEELKCTHYPWQPMHDVMKKRREQAA